MKRISENKCHKFAIAFQKKGTKILDYSVLLIIVTFPILVFLTLKQKYDYFYILTILSGTLFSLSLSIFMTLEGLSGILLKRVPKNRLHGGYFKGLPAIIISIINIIFGISIYTTTIYIVLRRT